MLTLKVLTVFFTSYLIGSIPFSLLIGFVWGVDIRKKGSGNVGATNVLRSCGKLPGTLAYIFDVGKGAAAVLLAGYLLVRFGIKGNLEESPLRFIVLASFLAPVLGHSFSPFIKFKGGKGVATAAGVLLMLMPLPFACVLAVFFVIFAATRIISISSMIASICVPVFLLVHHYKFAGVYNLEMVQDHLFFWVAVTSLLSVFIIYRHRSNISRLLKGEEHSFKKTSSVKKILPKKKAAAVSKRRKK